MDALLVVDVQRDFCPGGALPAEDGARILPAVNGAIARAHAEGWPIYASRDWHPVVTSHFTPYGGDWPPHCVQGTPGAAFHPQLQLPADAIVITKGQDPGAPGYSAFEGRTPDDRPFADDLRTRGVTRLVVAGIATDYCVKASALDARREGLDVVVLTDAVAGIDAQPGDIDRAMKDMETAGVTFLGRRT